MMLRAGQHAAVAAWREEEAGLGTKLPVRQPGVQRDYCMLGSAAMLALQSSLVFSFGSAKVSPNGSMNFRHSSSSPNANWDLIKSTGIDTRYLKVVEKKKTSEV